MSLHTDTHTELARLVEAAEEYATCEWIPQLGRELIQRHGYTEDQLVEHDSYRAALDVFTALLEVKHKLTQVERCGSA